MNIRSLYFLMIAVFLVSCSASSNKPIDQSSSKPRIVCTTNIVADALTQICGDSAEVIALMSAGVDPHLYKASQGDMEKLSNADYIFYNGLHLEGKMHEVLQQIGEQKSVLAVSEGLPKEQLRLLGEGVYDPHVWFDASLWALCAQTASDALQKAYPSKAAYFKQNTTAYVASLNALHNSTKQRLSQIPTEKRVLVTAHDAFGYFSKAYGIEVKSLQGVSTVTEPGLRDVTELVNWLTERKIGYIFAETSVSDKGIKAVMDGCKQKGHALQNGGTLFTDALGADDSPSGNYIGMFEANVTQIIASMR
ncbi:MAG: manganese transporter [Cytophagales bacterium]|nr:MAG: manganese transporter [Cytophagales bacterium]TAF61189.1 MAG: manganese transporter [Cytophagales bacterium]